MDSKVQLMLLAIVASVSLWLLGGFVVNHSLGIIFVFLSIVFLGLAAGNLMDTPEPPTDSK